MPIDLRRLFKKKDKSNTLEVQVGKFNIVGNFIVNEKLSSIYDEYYKLYESSSLSHLEHVFGYVDESTGDVYYINPFSGDDSLYDEQIRQNKYYFTYFLEFDCIKFRNLDKNGLFELANKFTSQLQTYIDMTDDYSDSSTNHYNLQQMTNVTLSRLKRMNRLKKLANWGAPQAYIPDWHNSIKIDIDADAVAKKLVEHATEALSSLILNLTTNVDGTIQSELVFGMNLVDDELKYIEACNVNANRWAEMIESIIYTNPGIKVKATYPPGDVNAGIFAVIELYGLIYLIHSNDTFVVSGNVITYTSSRQFSDIDEFCGHVFEDFSMSESRKKPMEENGRYEKSQIVTFEQLKDENVFNKLVAKEYFSKNPPSYQEVSHVMQVSENIVNSTVQLIGGIISTPPLYWFNNPDLNAVAFSSEYMGAGGIAINGDADVWKYSDEELSEIVVHELAHEIDGQIDLTQSQDNNREDGKGDQDLIDYLHPDNGYVEHDFSAWDNIYGGGEAEKLNAKLKESFADLFAKWVLHHVYNSRLKKADQEVMDYLDYLFGYMDWITNDGDVNNMPAKQSRLKKRLFN